MCQGIQVAARMLRSESNVLPLNSPYTHSLALVGNHTIITYSCGHTETYVSLHYIRCFSYAIHFTHHNLRVLPLLSNSDTINSK